MIKDHQNENPHDVVIVLVEYQNQWTRPGLYHWIISRVLNKNNVIRNTVDLVEKARRHGIPVVHAPLVIDPENKKGTFAHISRGLVFRKGSEAAQLDSRVYKKGDIVIEGRTAFDAFTNSTLRQTLAQLNPKTVLLGGFTTDQCVTKTLKTARSMGINTLLLADCCATITPFLQRHTEKKLAEFTTDSSFIGNLSQATARQLS